MHKIVVTFPADRVLGGELQLLDPAGKRLAGPFPVCGRVDDRQAELHHNSSRNPLLPFGDIPLGEYQVTQVVESGPGTSWDSAEFGSGGIVLLLPIGGDAALAEANGRFGFFIHGGNSLRGGALRPTEDGSLRLLNSDQRKLVGAMRRLGQAPCQCVITAARRSSRPPARSADSSRAAPSGGSGPKPATLASLAAAAITRRSWLRTMLYTGASATVPGFLFFAPKLSYADGDTGYGNVPPITVPGGGTAGQDANTVEKNSQDATHARTDEEAKVDSGVGIDTAGAKTPGGSSGGTGSASDTGSTNPTDSGSTGTTNTTDTTNTDTSTSDTSGGGSTNATTSQGGGSRVNVRQPAFVIPFIPPGVARAAVPPAANQAPAYLVSLQRSIDAIKVPPPIPASEAEIGFAKENGDAWSEGILDATDGGIAVLNVVMAVKGTPLSEALAVVVIVNKTLLAGAKAESIYLAQKDQDFERGLAYLKDAKTRAQFSALVQALRTNQPYDKNTDPDILRAAQAVADPSNNVSQNVFGQFWSLWSAPAREAALKCAVVESAKYFMGKSADQAWEELSDLPDAAARSAAYGQANRYLGLAEDAVESHSYNNAIGESMLKGLASDCQDKIIAAYKTEIPQRLMTELTTFTFGVAAERAASPPGSQ